MAIILSQSEITLRRERSTTEYKNALIAVMDAAKIMSSMIGRLLFLARLTSEQVIFEKEPIILNEIITKTVRLLKPVADLKRTCVNVCTAEDFRVSGDKLSLLQLYVNVIDNAIKYGPTQGKINVSIWRHEGFIVSEIKDHGIGIPQKDLDKIFDRFYRVDKSRSRDGGGMGLGMSICKAIVQQHSGKIAIKSSIGKGTAVLIYFEEVK